MTTEDSKHEAPGRGDHGHPPKTYQVLIDKTPYVFSDPTPSGRELLAGAGKLPVEQFAIYMKPPTGQPRRIQLDEKVDLRSPGVERFVTLPLDQTEGEGTSPQRRQFALPAEDMEWLDATGLAYELVVEGGALRVVLYGLAIPAGYGQQTADAHVRVEPGYPDVGLDMVWFHPQLTLSNAKPIASICEEPFDGRNWQRWSRHRTPVNPWRPGVDSLSTHFELVQEWLAREARKT